MKPTTETTPTTSQVGDKATTPTPTPTPTPTTSTSSPQVGDKATASSTSKDAKSSDTPPPKKPSLIFKSDMSFSESVEDQEGNVVGTISMVSLGTFEFARSENSKMSGSQHTAVGKRLTNLEKNFSRLKL